jgi:two-component system, cell cycle response regulator
MVERPPPGKKQAIGRPLMPKTVRFAKVTPPAPDAESLGVDQRETEKSLSIPVPFDRDHAILTLLTGPNAGQVFPLEVENLIGRDFDAQIRIDDGSLSRTHARISRQAKGTFVIEDLASTNGTFIGSDRIGRRELVSGDRIQLGPKLTLRFALTDGAEEMLQRQLFESSTRDHLTRAYNRRYLMGRIAAEVAHARRHATELGLLLFDIDQFKRTNDTHGHLVGDAVLRAVADRVAALIRLEDVFARFGGEEFVVLIRATGARDAVRLAERVRASMEAMTVRAEGAEVCVTISVGIASLAELPPEAAGKDLIALADMRLYRAKEEGRNRVCSEGL